MDKFWSRPPRSTEAGRHFMIQRVFQSCVIWLGQEREETGKNADLHIIVEYNPSVNIIYNFVLIILPQFTRLLSHERGHWPTDLPLIM